MQYWLINYDATCPSGWFTYSDRLLHQQLCSHAERRGAHRQDLATV